MINPTPPRLLQATSMAPPPSTIVIGDSSPPVADTTASTVVYPAFDMKSLAKRLEVCDRFIAEFQVKLANCEQDRVGIVLSMAGMSFKSTERPAWKNLQVKHQVNESEKKHYQFILAQLRECRLTIRSRMAAPGGSSV
ncbi:hypothetical protein H4R33_001522 [Dimargaris cristalligena]|nr:hypothetical protein H4R33_001522 [Dimargaris cristalligena]